ncbi:GSCOCG00009006001-RA-CDS [Cotesia congregata]|nr:GSCOCG00009006001-RA-CDS [Cotesia congregata]
MHMLESSLHLVSVAIYFQTLQLMTLLHKVSMTQRTGSKWLSHYFGDTNFSRFSICISIATKTFYIHLFGLLTQCLFVVHHMAHYLTVVINYQRHWYRIRKCKYSCNKVTSFTGVC